MGVPRGGYTLCVHVADTSCRAVAGTSWLLRKPGPVLLSASSSGLILPRRMPLHSQIRSSRPQQRSSAIVRELTYLSLGSGSIEYLLQGAAAAPSPPTSATSQDE